MCLAIPGEIISIAGEGMMRSGMVYFGGIEKDVSLAFVPGAAVGDFVLVHAGIAIGVIQPDQAMRIFENLEDLEDLEDLEETDEIY